MIPSAIYFEKQEFSQKWIKFLLNLLLLFTFSLSIFIYFYASKGMIAYLPFLIFLIIYIIFKTIKLEVEIDHTKIKYQFFPFQLDSNIIYKNEIDVIRVVKYDPLSEFGGWGIRFGKNGKAYTIAGSFGIRIILKNKKEVLIGSQAPQEVFDLLDTLGYNPEKKLNL